MDKADAQNSMRVVVWNCNNGMSKKPQIDYFKNLKADVAILPELKLSNIGLLSPDSHVWVTNNHTNPSPKGLGILTFNGFKLEALPRDEEMEIFIPVRVTKEKFTFNLLGVWNFYSASKQGRYKGVRGDKALEYEALAFYKSLLNDPCLVAGDWNLGPTFAQASYFKIARILEESGLRCLHQARHQLASIADAPATFKHSRGKARHRLDHIFGSACFAESITEFLTGNLDEVVLSDHAPLVLEISLKLN